MYQPSIVAHDFNHQFFYHQPILNLRQDNGIVWNQSYGVQQTHGLTPAFYSAMPTQQVVSANLESAKQHRKSKTYLEQDTTDNREDSVTEDFSDTYSIQRSSKQVSKSKTRSSSKHGSRLLSRQSSLDAVSQPKDIYAQNSKPLINSRSTGSIHDYIDRERRAHTMAPLTQILGPSSIPKAKLFASITAPNIASTMKSSQPAQTATKTSFPSKSQAVVQGNDISDSNDNREEEDEEDDDDDDAPIVVTVRYDPNTGGPPSEDTIRQAVDNQLKGQSGQNSTKDPILLDFLNHGCPPTAPQISMRPKQPVFNQSILPVSRPVIRSHPQNVTDSLQQILPPSAKSLDPQQQQLLLRQKQQQQQREYRELIIQQQRRLQQGLLLQQQKQREQQRLQQEALLQQHKDQQREQQRIQQEAILLQQKQQQQLRQELLLQQEKQNQQLQQFLQQQQQKRKQEHLRQIQQQKQRQLQLEQQRKQEQLRLFQLQKQQQLQVEQQQHREILQQQKQQQIYQEKHQINSLPPRGPPPARPVASIPPSFVTRPRAAFQQKTDIRPFPALPPAPVLKKTQQISSNNTQRLPERNMYSASASTLPAANLNMYSSSHRAYTPNIFVPINNGTHAKQYSGTINDANTSNGTEQLLQRSRTAPSITEMFRPSSALDTPELTRENLRSMLDQIPDLHGCHFKIEYLEPMNPDGYPVPLKEDSNNDKYPEPVVTDKLPNEIVQFVKSSNNQTLLSALDPSAYVQSNTRLVGEVQTTGHNLNRQSSAVRHTRPAQYRTYQS